MRTLSKRAFQVCICAMLQKINLFLSLFTKSFKKLLQCRVYCGILMMSAKSAAHRLPHGDFCGSVKVRYSYEKNN